MKIYLFTLLLFFALLPQSWAQSGSITGVAQESKENQLIGFAAVSLFSASDNKMLTGALTDANGRFILEKLNAGNYTIHIEFLGYETKKVDNVIFANNQKLDIGTAQLSPNTKLLQEILVTGQRASGSYV